MQSTEQNNQCGNVLSHSVASLPFLASPLNYSNQSTTISFTEREMQQNIDFPSDIFGELFVFTNLDQPEVNTTNSGPSIIPKENFSKIKEYYLRRLPEVKFLIDTISQYKEKTIKITKETLTEEVIQQIKREFDNYMHIFTTAFEQLGTPCIIWEKCNIIRYVNQAFIEATGFNSPLPTNLEDYAFNELLSTDGLRNYLSVLVQANFSLGRVGPLDDFCIPVDIKYGQTSNFISGNLWVSIKRDLHNQPLLLIGTFLPNNSISKKLSVLY